VLISLIKLVRIKETPLNLVLKPSKNVELPTGVATISTVAEFEVTIANFLALIFNVAANAGKI
jgi:hypothetical protein